MIVVDRFDEIRGNHSELVKAGYGYSVLSNLSPSEDYDLDTYIEMFSDWGWASCNERRPDWMR
jgi:hypothetical protein